MMDIKRAMRSAFMLTRNSHPQLRVLGSPPVEDVGPKRRSVQVDVVHADHADTDSKFPRGCAVAHVESAIERQIGTNESESIGMETDSARSGNGRSALHRNRSAVDGRVRAVLELTGNDESISVRSGDW